MSFRIATGRKFNLIERAAAALTVTSEHSSYLKARAFDGYADQPFMGNAAADPFDVTIDLNEIPNGDFETAFVSNLPTAAWVKVGAPTVTRTTTGGEFSEGVAACEVVGVTGTDYIYIDVPFIAGELGRITVATRRGSAAGVDSRVYVQNLQSGKYLLSNGTWSATKTPFANETGTSYQTVAQDFTIETFAQCGYQHEVTLRIILDGDGSAADGPLYDALFVWAAVDTAAVVYHNLSANVAMTLLSGTTSSPATNRATFSVRRPTFYATFAAVQSDRFWRFRASPANWEAIWYGELILTQSFALDRHPSYPVGESFNRPQLRAAGGLRRHRRSDFHQREYTLQWGLNTTTYLQARDEIVRRSAGGEYAVLAILDDTDAEKCIYGTIEPVWRNDEVSFHHWRGGLVLTELPGPTFIP